MLELKKICKIYQTGTFKQQALKNISLKFRKNEFVAILGASGSGKTTMLNIIGGLDHYDTGDLIINGKSTKKFKSTDWDKYRNNCVGFIFQSYNLISHISILDNVMMTMTLSNVKLSTKKKKAMAVLKKVGLDKHAHKRPNQLSGGQMQRVAIARAIVNDPDIILADEPTGALDSTTSIQIMELIKEISKDKLVIMVTHNADLAHEYSNRIVELKDGSLVSDSSPVTDNYNEEDKFNIKKTAMSFFTALKLSFNNIRTKKTRTLITAFASSIGIIGISLILSLSNGFDKQIDKFESNTLSNFPISITETVANVDMEEMDQKSHEMMGMKESKDAYLDLDVVYPFDSLANLNVHYNDFSKEYIDYIENIDKTYVNAIQYYRYTGLNILFKNNEEYKPFVASMETALFTSFPKDFTKEETYVKDNYDLLYGEYPKNIDEVVLVVDSKNRVDIELLKLLNIDYNRKEIDLSEFVGIEFKAIMNDDFYTEMPTQDKTYYTFNPDYANIYNSENNINLKIVGVIRGTKDNKMASMTSTMYEMMGISGVSSIGYSNALMEKVIEINSNSKIVNAQKNSAESVIRGFNLEIDKLLLYLGSENIPLLINIYPIDFESKDEIIKYLDKYNENKKEEDQIIYTDYAEEFSSLAGNIMDAITIVLIAFSSISLVVSSIMIGIITYISVLERTREIGILRSLGARKKDITRVFNAETFIIGLSSGLIGIAIARLLIIPINMIIKDMTGLANVACMNIVHILLLLIVSTMLTMLGGFIPAKIASKKDPVEALRSE